MKKESTKKLAYYRDNKILEFIEEWQVVDTHLVRMNFFPNTQYGLRKCQDRLQSLAANGLVKSRMLAKDRPYAYFISDHEQLEHKLDINYCRQWVTQNLKNGESIWTWKYEQDFSLLRTDATYALKNAWKNDLRFWCLEVERSRNRMVKGELYNKLYDSRQHIWPYDHDNRFPAVLIVKDGKMDIKNPNGLQIESKTLTSIKEEVKSR